MRGEVEKCEHCIVQCEHFIALRRWPADKNCEIVYVRSAHLLIHQFACALGSCNVLIHKLMNLNEVCTKHTEANEQKLISNEQIKSSAMNLRGGGGAGQFATPTSS